jgi:hypothetical protein
MIGSWIYLRLFFHVLDSARESRGREDKLWWIPSKRGLFRVKVLYHSLDCNVVRSFPWKSVWRT